VEPAPLTVGVGRPGRCSRRFAFSPWVNLRMLRNMSESESRMREFRSHLRDFLQRRLNMWTAEAVCEELTGSVQEIVQASSEASQKARLSAVARHVGLPVGRIRKYYYGEIVCPPAHEADAIRHYKMAAMELLAARKKYEGKRARFMAAYPALARFAPGPLVEDEVSAEAEDAAGSDVADT
jgi:hypothetical protein